MKLNFWQGIIDGKQVSEDGISIKEAKSFLKKYGGEAYTHHCDRSGSVQEVTPIVIGNNRKTAYDVTYNTSKKTTY